GRLGHRQTKPARRHAGLADEDLGRRDGRPNQEARVPAGGSERVMNQPTPGNGRAVIAIHDLAREYVMGGETVRALDGVSFVVERGEYLAIMGPSGSGKTTLMNILGCLDTPSGGEYRLDGQLVSGLSERELAR